MNLELTLEEVALIFQISGNVGGLGPKRVALDSIYNKLSHKFNINIYENPFNSLVYLSNGPLATIEIRE